MTMRNVLTAASLAAITAAASAGTVSTDSFGALSTAPFIGTGIGNTNFTINTNDYNGVQTGLKALERFTGDLMRSGNTYFAEPGESNTSGAAGAPVDPGKATWNYFMAVDLNNAMTGYTFADVLVNVAVDFNTDYNNTDVFEFELVGALAAQSVDISGLSLFQSSENLGFNYWQAIGDPDIYAFDPFASGQYSMTVEVVLRSDGSVLSNTAMNVVVVPLPTAGVAGLAGLTLLGARRRRNTL
jgi:hypothetical protein